eukprot:TRINITY_DN437_c0_g2_i4.p1 TRINITY_DN437_c0_g2~~TRINITY_DN437_c0_g2_i4.p1  ORF type:complete len:654 (-),score=224.66 TRINITY_DN437_c0_g2_i4:29-1990(-)
MAEESEKFSFQAEVGKMMKILSVHLYRNKEVFLRELISNASDALDKIRFKSLTDKAALATNKLLQITIKVDKDARTLTIADSGVGMTKDDLVNNLGTIAKSGTQAFAEALEKGAGSSLIGQFGVGFYSAYLVADKIEVTSKNNDDPTQWIWTSTDQSSYSVVADPKGDTLGRGTRITLHLKAEPEFDDYLDNAKLKELIVKYSQFIDFPIYVWESKEVEKTDEELDEEDLAAESEDASEESEEEEGQEEEQQEERSYTKTVWDWTLVNTTKPLWLRNKKDISETEYNDFYKAITKDEKDPSVYIHFNAEGDVDFKSVLYLPSEPPFTQFDPHAGQKGVKLYVRRVFITDDFEAVIPKYLGFLKGVVDSDSLPLNISREMLQENKSLQLIKKKLVRKAVAMFQSLTEDVDKYNQFWKNYGTNIKLGVIEDVQNRSRLAKLVRFVSSHTGELTSFDDYVERMKEGQDQIYVLAGNSVDEVKKSPLLEALSEQKYEVLFMTEPIDEYTMTHLAKYDSKYKITNVAKEGVNIGEKEEIEKEEEETVELRKYIKDSFPDKVGKVVVSSRLTKSPVALVAEAAGYTATMERVIQNQALASRGNSDKNWVGKKVLEINVRHPLIKRLDQMVSADKHDPEAFRLVELLIDSAAITLSLIHI